MRAVLSSLKYCRVATELDNSQTEYWLDLLHETKYLDDKMYESIHSDCVELVKMLTAAIKKLKE
ncbi:MAG: four helix bundle protein [Prevotella sp.]|nr:four helix bundle protein [Prevotella sp.]